MSQKNVILRGAFFLTAASAAGRMIGFFYRIFLSRLIGAEGMGIYQLVFPFYALVFSLTVSGIQTTISRFVSAKTASGDKQGAVSIFHMGLGISVVLSLIASGFLLRFHQELAVSFARESRCSDLLRLLAYSIPFASVHACIDGYYYGLKHTEIPAAGQITEHVVRLGAVMVLAAVWEQKGIPLTPSIAVYGIITEEFAAALFSATAITIHFSRQPARGKALYSSGHYMKELLALSVPLTLNRVLVNLLQSMEAFLIPFQLKLAGMNGADSLSVYGILTGMALPLILFPNTVTSSVSTMLLPVISEAQATGNRKQIARAIRKTCGYCLALGLCCWLCFFTLGGFLGNFLFHNKLAGSFISSLAWLCPLLYLNPALFAILNGLGRTGSVFFHNTCGILVRIAFILFAIPKFGILGYFWGLVAAQALLTALSLLSLKKELTV